MHFQGYIVDIMKKEIIHIDSLRPENGRNLVSDIIAKVLFEQKEVRFKSYFTTRAQFDSNSCGVWLIAAMAAYVHSLPKPSVRNDAFDIAFSLLERKNFEMKMLCLKFLHLKTGKVKAILIYTLQPRF